MGRRRQYEDAQADYIERTYRHNGIEEYIPKQYDSRRNRRFSGDMGYRNFMYDLHGEKHVQDPYWNNTTYNPDLYWTQAKWPRQHMNSSSLSNNIDYDHSKRSRHHYSKTDPGRRSQRYLEKRYLNLLLLLIIIVLLVVVTIPLLIIFVFGAETPVTEGTIIMELKLSDQFQRGMEDHSSTVFKSTETSLCTAIESAFTADENSEQNATYVCQLTSLRNGSIIVNVVLRVTGRYSIPDNNIYVQTITTYIGTKMTLGPYTVISGSIVIISASYTQRGVTTTKLSSPISSTSAATPTTTTPTSTTTPTTTTTILNLPEMEMNDSMTTPEEDLHITCRVRYAPSGWDNFSIVSSDNADVYVTAFSNGTIVQGNNSYTARLQQSNPDMRLSVLFPNTTTHCYARGSYVCTLTDNGNIVINTTATVIIADIAKNLMLEGNSTVNEGDRYELNCSGRLAKEGGDLHLHVRSVNSNVFFKATEVPIVTVGQFNDLCYQSITKSYNFLADKAYNGTEFVCMATNDKLSSSQHSSSINMKVNFAEFNAQFHLQNATWIPSFGDKDSVEFKDFAEKIERDTDYVYGQSAIKDNYKRSKVTELKPGSVKVIVVIFIEIEIRIIDGSNNVITTRLTPSDIVDAFVDTLPNVANDLTDGDLASVDRNIAGRVITGPGEEYECSSTKTDVVFLLDASGSIGATNFNLTKFFIKNITANILLGPDTIQVSVVTFSSSPRYGFWLNEHYGVLTLNPAIEAIVYTSGGTRIAAGLEFVRDSALDPANGARADSEKVVILMTDGVSSDNSASIASTLRNEGVLVACVGIGSGINVAQLTEIAYNSSYIFYAENFDVLTQIRDTVRSSTCDAVINND